MSPAKDKKTRGECGAPLRREPEVGGHAAEGAGDRDRTSSCARLTCQATQRRARGPSCPLMDRANKEPIKQYYDIGKEIGKYARRS